MSLDFSVLPSVGDRVVVHGKNAGTVRYVGPVKYAKGDDWCGVEMDDAGVGKNNGTVKGHSYFTCQGGAKNGLLVRSSAVQSEEDAKLSQKTKKQSKCGITRIRRGDCRAEVGAFRVGMNWGRDGFEKKMFVLCCTTVTHRSTLP